MNSTHLKIYHSLFDCHRAYSFPCDEDGHVDLDSMSRRGRDNYYFAHAMVGKEFRTPVVVVDSDHVLTLIENPRN